MAYNFFVSHFSRDREIAESIAKMLDKITLSQVNAWYSSDESESGGLQPGNIWFNEIINKINKSKALICILTPYSVNRPWIYFESGIAHSLESCEVIPVCIGIERNLISPPLGMFQCYNLEEYSAMREFISKLLKRFDIKFDEHLSKKIIESTVKKLRNIIFEEPNINLETSRFKYISTEKVATLKWSKLTDVEQKHYFEKFLELKPQANKPRHSLIPIAKQEDLSNLNPIDLSPLKDLLESFNIDHKKIKLPLSEDEYNEIHSFDLQIAEVIYNGILRGLTLNQNEAIDNFYDYLSGSNIHANIKHLKECDLIIVPGTRNVSRVDEAFRICQLSGATLILSGAQPSYHTDDEELQISEAEAMAYYVQKIKKLNIKKNKIIIESRAKSTRETSVHILPDIQKLFIEKKAPLNIILVTGHYHVRRFFLLVNKSLHDFRHTVNSLTCVAGPAIFDRQIFTYNPDEDEQLRKYGITIFIQEYFKIIGGRAVGEI